MIESLVLDSLLILILALLIPIGAYRGGIREGFTSAGVLLGVAISAEWAVTWGDWVADNSRLAEGSARFLIAIGLLTVATLAVGYGSSGAFAYRPGPGGRLYGALLAATNGAVFLSYVLDYISTFLFDNDRPALIENSYVARALSVGTGVILLCCVGVVALATAFGLIVRERGDDESMGVDMPAAGRRRQWRSGPGRRTDEHSARVDKVEPHGTSSGSLVEETIPVQIREVRHWERESSDSPGAEQTPGGWTHTWPASSVSDTVGPPWQRPSQRAEPASRRNRGQTNSRQNAANPGSDVLQVWLRQDGDSGASDGRSVPSQQRKPTANESEREE